MDQESKNKEIKEEQEEQKSVISEAQRRNKKRKPPDYYKNNYPVEILKSEAEKNQIELEKEEKLKSDDVFYDKKEGPFAKGPA